MIRRIRRIAAASGLLMALAGCAIIHSPMASPPPSDPSADANQAMVQFARGNIIDAKQLADAVLVRDPKNAYAILVEAEIAENSGEFDVARARYASLVGTSASWTVLDGTGTTARKVTVSDLAQKHLTALAGVGAPGAAANAAFRRPLATPTAPPKSNATVEQNIVSRFATLDRLLADGLISQDEYNARRNANIGALTPEMAGDGPGAGLGYPPPSTIEVENRLQALVASYQNHDISSETALAERAIVLDALMPANPQRREALPKRVTDQASADSEADRLNRMEAARVISADEAARARAQLYAGVPAPEQATTAAAAAGEPVASTPPALSAPAMPPAAKPPAPAMPKAAPPKLPPPSSLNDKGPSANAVALASYSSEAQATQGWAALQKQFPAQLATLSISVKPETTKSGATFYRINAGPITNRDAAIAVCKEIRAKRQYCEPALLK